MKSVGRTAPLAWTICLPYCRAGVNGSGELLNRYAVHRCKAPCSGRRRYPEHLQKMRRGNSDRDAFTERWIPAPPTGFCSDGCFGTLAAFFSPSFASSTSPQVRLLWFLFSTIIPVVLESVFFSLPSLLSRVPRNSIRLPVLRTSSLSTFCDFKKHPFVCFLPSLSLLHLRVVYRLWLVVFEPIRTRQTTDHHHHHHHPPPGTSNHKRPLLCRRILESLFRTRCRWHLRSQQLVERIKALVCFSPASVVVSFCRSNSPCDSSGPPTNPPTEFLLRTSAALFDSRTEVLFPAGRQR